MRSVRIFGSFALLTALPSPRMNLTSPMSFQGIKTLEAAQSAARPPTSCRTPNICSNILATPVLSDSPKIFVMPFITLSIPNPARARLNFHTAERNPKSFFNASRFSSLLTHSSNFIPRSGARTFISIPPREFRGCSSAFMNPNLPFCFFASFSPSFFFSAGAFCFSCNFSDALSFSLPFFLPKRSSCASMTETLCLCSFSSSSFSRCKASSSNPV